MNKGTSGAGLRRRELLAGLAALPAAGWAAPDGLQDWGRAPELRGILQWFNSEPLTLAGLRGKVVLIDFWTFACINCLRTLPHVRQWATEFQPAGLQVIGIHTPEFASERSPANVERAMRRHKVSWPVALDKDYATWKAFENRYWPAHYLIDAEGRIRYRHFGEGNYERTEAAIRALLGRPGRA